MHAYFLVPVENGLVEAAAAARATLLAALLTANILVKGDGGETGNCSCRQCKGPNVK